MKKNKDDKNDHAGNSIRFFISSTFSDMKKERSSIQKIIYPELREYGSSKGIFVDICDLRWGIDQETEEKYKGELLVKIMDVCFREIKECKPYFVTMIGSSYGTIPTEEQFKKIKDSNEAYKPLRELKNDYSLTHLEMISAGLVNTTGVPDYNFLCFFRDDHKKKDSHTKSLVSEIENRKEKTGCGDLIVTTEYSTTEEFITEFVKKGMELIDNLEEKLKNSNNIGLEFQNARAYTLEKSKFFAGRKKEMENIQKKLKEENVVKIFGASGIGKTSIMSKLFNSDEYRAEKKYFIAGGIGGESSQYINVLRQIVYILKKENNGETPDISKINKLVSESEAETMIKTLGKLYNRGRKPPIYLFIDAVDKIECEDRFNITDILSGPSNKKVKCLYSKKETVLNGSQNNEILIEELSPDDVVSVILKKVYPAENNENTQDISGIVSELLSKEESKYPLYIDSATHLLKMSLEKMDRNKTKPVDIFRGEIKKMGNTVESVCWQAIEKTGKETAPEIWKDIIGLIGVSNKGLRENDLAEMIGDRWNSTDFTLFRQNLYFFFRSNPGFYWVFEHDRIKKSVRQNLTDKEKKDYCKTISRYISHYRTDTTLLYREGWRLSVGNKCGRYKKRLEHRLLNIAMESNDRDIKTVIAQELHDVMDDAIVKAEDFNTWMMRLIKEYGVCLFFKMLNNLIRMEGDNEDFNRRYPAMRIADRFWCVFNYLYFSLEEWEKEEEQDFVLQLEIARMCKEYISGCESFGRGNDAVKYTKKPVDFYIGILNNSTDEGLITEAKIALNSILFDNNKACNRSDKSAVGHSEKIVDIYKEKYVLQDYFSLELTSKFESNIGQYYNGIKEYDNALIWHMKSILSKLDFIEKVWDASAGVTDELRKELEKNEIILWKTDRQFTLVKKMLSSADKKKGDIRKAFIKFAVSYRTIGSDIYYKIDEIKNKQEKKKYAKILIGSHKLSWYIMKKIDNGKHSKEIMTSQLRWIGSILKVKHIINCLAEETDKRDVVDIYIENIEYYTRNISLYGNDTFYNDLEDYYDEICDIINDENKKKILTQLYKKMVKDQKLLFD